MAEVMGLIDQERVKHGMSAEKFANKYGITAKTYSRQRHDKQMLGLDTIRAYAKFAREVGSTDILRALGAYTLEIEPEQITINPSK